jgi:valyl-tRNA synthetase
VQILGPDAPEDAVPKGCAVFVVNHDVVLQVDVASTIKDVDAEIKKIQAKLQKSRATAKKQAEIIGAEGFFEKASEVVAHEEKKKLKDALATAENYEKTIEEFEKLKIGA